MHNYKHYIMLYCNLCVTLWRDAHELACRIILDVDYAVIVKLRLVLPLPHSIKSFWLEHCT